MLVSLNANAIVDWVKGLVNEEPVQSGGSDIVISNPLVRMLQEDLQNGWNARDDWDEAFFIEMHKKIELIGVNHPVATQRNFNAEQAITKIHNKIFQEWSKSDCQHQVITNYIKATSVVKKYDKNTKSNYRLDYINKVYVEYNKARKLAMDKFVLNPNYNHSAFTWKKYSDYRHTKEIEIQQMRNNYLYINHLCNISLLRLGLSEQKVNERFAAGRKAFDKSLSKAIKSGFENDASTWGYTWGGYNNLRSVSNKYYGESNDDGGALKGYEDYYYVRIP